MIMFVTEPMLYLLIFTQVNCNLCENSNLLLQICVLISARSVFSVFGSQVGRSLAFHKLKTAILVSDGV